MRAATNQFMKQADCLGYQLAFYKISESYVVMLHELGFHFTKVGEAGIVDLATEDLSRLSQQLEYQRLMKEGYHFTWYDQLPEELHQAVNEVSQNGFKVHEKNTSLWDDLINHMYYLAVSVLSVKIKSRWLHHRSADDEEAGGI